MKIIESNFTQEVTLPSQGYLNPEIPEGKLVQRCMMVADQKFLSGSNQDPQSALHQILQRTTTSPESFDVKKLTLQDTIYLLFKLRVLSYGNTHKFRTRCPECGKKIDVTVDISELPVELLDENYAENLVIELPHRKDTVYIKLLTNRDLESVENEVKRRKRRGDEESSEYVLRIVQSIEKIKLASPNKDGKSELTHPLDIELYVNSLTDLDAAAIIAARDRVHFGVSPITEVKCPECGEYIEVSLQFSGDFFRPQFDF